MSERFLPVIVGLGVGISLIVLFAIELPEDSTTNNTKSPLINLVKNTNENRLNDNMTLISVVRISAATTPTVTSREVIGEHAIIDKLLKGTDIKYANYIEKCRQSGGCQPQLYYSETREYANITLSEAKSLIGDHRLGLSAPCYDNGACTPEFYSNLRVEGGFYQLLISDKDNRILKDLMK